MPKRCLNEIELEEAEKLFANKIDLNRVRILEHSKFAKMGKILWKSDYSFSFCL
jgi:hypothetical protein